jgi:hypothetical protein
MVFKAQQTLPPLQQQQHRVVDSCKRSGDNEKFLATLHLTPISFELWGLRKRLNLNLERKKCTFKNSFKTLYGSLWQIVSTDKVMIFVFFLFG